MSGLGMAGWEAALYGATVTFENPEGRRVTLVRYGKVTEAVRACCDDAIRADPGYRVVAVSTPTSIFADLRQRDHAQADGGVQRPEASILRKAGRGSLLHPLLAGQSRHTVRKRFENDRAETA